MNEETYQALKDLGEGEKAPVIHKLSGSVVVERAQINEERMIIPFILSTDQVDRARDSIMQDGWELENYRRNPVVLWGHNTRMMPIGRNLNVRVVTDGGVSSLRADTQFMDPELIADERHAQLTQTVFDMYRLGYLNAKSVGFRPLDFTFAQDDDRPFGMNFIRQELLEDSAVTVPMNPGALIDARSAGIDMDPIARFAAETLDLLAPEADEREWFERVFTAAAPSRAKIFTMGALRGAAGEDAYTVERESAAADEIGADDLSSQALDHEENKSSGEREGEDSADPDALTDDEKAAIGSISRAFRRAAGVASLDDAKQALQKALDSMSTKEDGQ